MLDNNRGFANDMARLDAELGHAIERRHRAPSRSSDSLLGEDSALLRGLLAAMTSAGAPGRG